MPAPKTTFQAPKGTRDAYPQDLLRRRYITESWRAVSIRHGFEEIDGPTFEEADLYAVKSGEGILGELFQAFSGKSDEEREAVMQTGRAPYALRPEFTPTLARMYAARAKQLSGVTRWFCIQPFFRAERPQRGRLREFYQWNCDVVGVAQVEKNENVQCVMPITGLLGQVGIDAADAKVLTWTRQLADRTLEIAGLPPANQHLGYELLDSWDKAERTEIADKARFLGIDDSRLEALIVTLNALFHYISTEDKNQIDSCFSKLRDDFDYSNDDIGLLIHADLGIELPKLMRSWFIRCPTIVRGLAYYTGLVFEVIAEGERAVAGGGRYDNLIELFGGPPTPAVGFGMGDVVLTNLLDDRGLMPEGPALRDAIDRTVRSVRLRPDVFVIPGSDEVREHILPLLAQLRRGVEREGFAEDLADGRAKPWDADRYAVPPLHARASDKTTGNLKKLLADAERQHARFAAVVHARGEGEPPTVQLKDLDRREDVGDFPSALEAPDGFARHVAQRTFGSLRT